MEKSTNLSKIKREKLLGVLGELKQIEGIDQSKITAINEIENELTKMRYGLLWEEHEEEVDRQLLTQLPVFHEDSSREIKLGKEDEKNVNFLLEGDNLHSLKLLEKTHRNKIDVIYIDPPYNTGKKDFKYGDKMVDELDDFRHSKWLSFMAKRLEIARELLTEEGVIFISIDDNEQAPLKMLCDSVFGNNNFIDNFMWLHGKGKKTKQSRTLQQYNLCYAKNRFSLGEWVEKTTINYKFTNPDNDIKGSWFSGSVSFNEERSNKKHKNYYQITSPSGIVWERQWQVTKEEMQELIEEGDIYWGGPPAYDKVPRKKIRPSDIEIIPTNIIDNKGTTKSASTHLNNIIGKSMFDYPKPVELIKHFISITNNKKDATILDYFAGSGTTGQAVLELNKEDQGNRTFILCTNNEVGEDKEKEFTKVYGDKEDNPKEWEEWEEQYGIARSITYKRLQKVVEGYTTPKGKEVEGISANLKYYKTGYVSIENPEDEDYEVEDEIVKHIIELVQLENHISIGEKEVGLILSDTDTDKEEDIYNERHIIENEKRWKELKKIYVAEDLILTDGFYKKAEQHNIQIYKIPRYYL